MIEKASPENGVQGSHVEPDQLLLYTEGMLDETESDEIRRHLVACRACAKELLTLNTPLDFEVTPSDPPPKFASWEALAAHVRSDSPETTAEASVTPLPESGSSRRSRWLPIASIAACFVIASFFWPSRQPPIAYTNAEVLSLVPSSQITRGETPAGRGSQPLVLRLNFAEPTSAENFELQIRLQGAVKPLWESSLQREPDGSFLVIFGPGFFSPGLYETTLLAEGATLATYRFKLSQN